MPGPFRSVAVLLLALAAAACAPTRPPQPMAEIAFDAPLDVVFMDPPFEMVREKEGLDRVLTQAERLLGKLKPKSFFVLRLPEIEGNGPRIPGFDGPEHHQYGKEQHVMLYCPSAKAAQKGA